MPFNAGPLTPIASLWCFRVHGRTVNSVTGRMKRIHVNHENTTLTLLFFYIYFFHSYRYHVHEAQIFKVFNVYPSAFAFGQMF
jgi:hypothetical protein